MKHLLILLTVFITTSAFSYGEGDHHAIGVSIVQLIAAPDKYDGKVVRVIGVAQVEFEGNVICLSKEDLKNGVTKNCLWHSPNYKQMTVSESILSKFNAKYVLMEGTFNPRNTGHMGLTSGALENVTRYQLWSE